MNRIVNRKSGVCRVCGQDVAPHQGFAVHSDLTGTWEVEHDGACPPSPHNPTGAPTWRVGGGEGYGQQPYTPGQTLREAWTQAAGAAPGPDVVLGGQSLADEGQPRGVSGIVTVVTATQKYYPEEGMSFGVGDEQGHFFAARVRAATDEEATPVLNTEARHAMHTGLRERVRRLLAWRSGNIPDAVRPPAGAAGLDGLQRLPTVPLRPHDEAPPYADELRLDEAGGWLWTLVHHGLDGDDWETNNLGRQIATRHPLTPERRQLVTDLHLAYASLEDWARTGIPADAAQILIAAGAALDDVTAVNVAVSITSAADARAYLARTRQQWADTGWAYPQGQRWPAADAAALADAAFSHSRADRYRLAGFDSVQKILAAQPPQLPTTPGRFVLSGCGVGPRVQITDDPAAAQRHLDDDPPAWPHWSHIPDVTVQHTATGSFGDGPDWQLWSDREITVGYWSRTQDRRRVRVTSCPRPPSTW